MSISEVEPERPPTAAGLSDGARRAATVSAGLLIRVGLVVALLAASGAVRLWQARRVEARMALGRESPFPLETVPMTLGTWAGTATDLDPRIVEATGSTDHITRRYVDQVTGATVDVIVLYGPTSDVFIHSPELCYPKAGYVAAGDAMERPVDCGGRAVPFRSLAYARAEPGQSERQEVHYSWRYNGRWSTAVSSPKESERIPGMYKVQVSRRIAPGEARAVENPSESFLGVLIPEIESRIVAGGPPAPASIPPA